MAPKRKPQGTALVFGGLLKRRQTRLAPWTPTLDVLKAASANQLMQKHPLPGSPFEAQNSYKSYRYHGKNHVSKRVNTWLLGVTPKTSQVIARLCVLEGFSVWGCFRLGTKMQPMRVTP